MVENVSGVAISGASIELARDLDNISGLCAHRRCRSLYLPEMAPITQGLQSHDRCLDCVLCFRFNPGRLGLPAQSGIDTAKHERTTCRNELQRLRSIINPRRSGIAVCVTDSNSTA